MKTRLSRLAPVAVALAFALAMMPNAMAQCMLPKKAVKPASWNSSHIAGPRLVRAALLKQDDDDDEPSIVGMWHVIFTAQTPGGNFELDNAVVVWHKDGTEVMNSNRPAQDGNFCLGVWAKTGKLKYILNHIPWGGNDPANAPSGIGNPQTGVQLLEAIKLSPDGNSYSGNFTLTAYDANKKVSASFTGVLTATRITTSTSITDLF